MTKSTGAAAPPAETAGTGLTFGEDLIGQVISRAATPGYQRWWAQVTASGFCTAPIHLTSTKPISVASAPVVLARCKNRRASVCPSCSDLYAGDTWQLVQAGLGGGHGIPATIAAHPAVFATLTAPSFGPVHTTSRDTTGRPLPCHPDQQRGRCRHHRPRQCHDLHDSGDEALGQPLCPDCYDYPAHVLFSWHAPGLWARFTTTLRRLVRRELKGNGEDPTRIKVSFVKIVEMQRRACPHFHAVIRLDHHERDHGQDTTDTTERTNAKPPLAPTTHPDATTLARLVHQAAAATRLEVAGADSQLITVRFGGQTDTQTLTRTAAAVDGRSAEVQLARRIAGYLAKYVTKSVTEFGVNPRRMSPRAIDTLPVNPHIHALLHTITDLAAQPGREPMLGWLHTLGYRGHITTKSRQYSTTMTALRAHRAAWKNQNPTISDISELAAHPATEGMQRTAFDSHSPAGTSDADDPDQDRDGDDDDGGWEFTTTGHNNAGEHFLVFSAALRAREARWAGRQLADPPPHHPGAA